jgi:hypothetical protein
MKQRKQHDIVVKFGVVIYKIVIASSLLLLLLLDHLQT